MAFQAQESFLEGMGVTGWAPARQQELVEDVQQLVGHDAASSAKVHSSGVARVEERGLEESSWKDYHMVRY